MPLEFIDLNYYHVVAVNCDNRKAMGKEKWHKKRFEKSTKNHNIKIRQEKNDKIEIKTEINKQLYVNSYYDENWKVITICLIMVTVIIEIIVKMIVMIIINNNISK